MHRDSDAPRGLTIELATHSAHACCDDVALLPQRAASGILDCPHALDAQHAWKLDAGRVALAREELRAVQSVGLDADEDMAGLGRWRRVVGCVDELGRRDGCAGTDDGSHGSGERHSG